MQPGGNQNGFPNQNNGNGQNPFMGNNGFFSIPPEKTVQLKMRTVCLDYGLPDPTVADKYELRRLENRSQQPGTAGTAGELFSAHTQDVVQAAAWHLANGLSWNQIANLPDNEVAALAGGTKFSTATVKSAQALVKQREQSAKDREKAAPAPSVAPAKIVRTSPEVEKYVFHNHDPAAISIEAGSVCFYGMSRSQAPPHPVDATRGNE